MRITRLAIIGAAVAVGIGYIIKKNEEGESILDEFTEQAPEWLEKIKDFGIQSFKKFVSDISE